MPQIKITQGTATLTIDTDQPVMLTDPQLISIMTALHTAYGVFGVLDDIEIERIDVAGIFTYVLKAGGGRIYRQNWQFDTLPITVSFNNTIGNWTVPELMSNIAIRTAAHTLHLAVGLQRLKCKW